MITVFRLLLFHLHLSRGRDSEGVSIAWRWGPLTTVYFLNELETDKVFQDSCMSMIWSGKYVQRLFVRELSLLIWATDCAIKVQGSSMPAASRNRELHVHSLCSS